MNQTDRTNAGQRMRTLKTLNPGATGNVADSGRTTDKVSPEEWFERGCEREEAGQSHEAMRCYRRAIDAAGPSASRCFNLANVLYRLRRKAEAVDFYRQALAIDDQLHEAWNNLGVVLCELKQCDEAVRTFQRAATLAPWFADPLFNLADCLDERGQTTVAQPYWRDYLRLDMQSPWSDYARSRLV